MKIKAFIETLHITFQGLISKCYISTGLRILPNVGTSRGTNGTLVNRNVLLVPQFPLKIIIFGRFRNFRFD